MMFSIINNRRLCASLLNRGRCCYSTFLRSTGSGSSSRSPLLLHHHHHHKVQQLYHHHHHPSSTVIVKRCLSFNFAGPRKLDEILKKELVEDKSPTEVADLWYTYHESKENVHGLVLKGEVAKNLLSRAASSPFFIQPVFRDDGYFMMISQFQEPSHFFMAYLEDYKMDPGGAQPLLTFSIFDDYAENKNLVLIRADILNKGLAEDEGYKLVQSMLDVYINDDEYMIVNSFNKKPDTFDFDDYVSRQNAKWRSGDGGSSSDGDRGSEDNPDDTTSSSNTK